MEQIWNADSGMELDEAEALVTFIKKYESVFYPIFEKTNPVEVIKLTLEEKGLKNKDLLEIFGSESVISIVLNNQKQLTLKMVRVLHKLLGIPLKL